MSLDLFPLVKHAAALTVYRRWLWLPALLWTIVLDLPGMLVRPFLPEPTQLLTPNSWEQLLILGGDLTQNIPELVISLFVLSIVFGGFWALAAIGQAVLIVGVKAEQEEAQIQTIDLWRKGRNLLGRFIAIDTVVLFPLFVNLLLILLLLGGMSGGLLLALRRGESVSMLIGVMGALLIPLICLILPLGLLAYLYRLLAFRFAALDDLTTREAIKRVRPYLKEKLMPIILLLVLTGVVSYGLGGLLFIFHRGLLFGQNVVLATSSFPIVEAIVLVVSFFIALFKNLFLSACWTLGMLQMG